MEEEEKENENIEKERISEGVEKGRCRLARRRRIDELGLP